MCNIEKEKLPFKRPELSDKPWVQNCLEKSGFMGCEYSFGNTFIWSYEYDLKICNYKGFYFIKNGKGNKTVYTFPAGEGDLKEAVLAMAKDSFARGVPFEMKGVTQENAEILENMFEGFFDKKDCRGDSDYIYLTEKLVNLSGKKLQSKRNHIARFKDNPHWSYEEIDENNIEECRQMSRKWFEVNSIYLVNSLEMEQRAVEIALNDFKGLGFKGGLLRREGEVIAFTIGERLNNDTFVVHIEKAYYDIQGAYPLINQLFASNACKGYKYINREEDMGDEGLRKAKLSYHPDILLTKYRLKLKECITYDKLCQERNDSSVKEDLEHRLCGCI